ncbi:hypothetical protein GOP47_0006071 [Adiantum capillus-veneris]|uniref:Uncharacterized protein n=1 Tax=Adiantum capillus-veneris TaxID=13818 RepID=A0A9D4ZMP7_ADICA|nr:hypothetical protein GOP47_0006071 [Adiantum capillus-veneris]
MVLSDMGLHGGNVKIQRDEKRSTAEKDVPCKPSIGGVKARRFLSKPQGTRDPKLTKHGKIYNTSYVSKVEYQSWKKLHIAVKDHEPTTRNGKAEVWRSIDILFLMCDKDDWSQGDMNKFKENLNLLKKSFKTAWTDTQITHYMHIIFNHLPYFIQKYGNPAIWNTQGMEKSHYMARNAYFRHTRHGGSRIKANSLRELFEWFYRRIIHRMQAKEVLANSATAQAIRHLQQQKAKRSMAYNNSGARESQRRWRETMVYVNHKWRKIL